MCEVASTLTATEPGTESSALDLHRALRRHRRTRRNKATNLPISHLSCPVKISYLPCRSQKAARLHPEHPATHDAPSSNVAHLANTHHFHQVNTAPFISTCSPNPTFFPKILARTAHVVIFSQNQASDPPSAFPILRIPQRCTLPPKTIWAAALSFALKPDPLFRSKQRTLGATATLDPLPRFAPNSHADTQAGLTSTHQNTAMHVFLLSTLGHNSLLPIRFGQITPFAQGTPGVVG